MREIIVGSETLFFPFIQSEKAHLPANVLRYMRYWKLVICPDNQRCVTDCWPMIELIREVLPDCSIDIEDRCPEIESPPDARPEK